MCVSSFFLLISNSNFSALGVDRGLRFFEDIKDIEDSSKDDEDDINKDNKEDEAEEDETIFFSKVSSVIPFWNHKLILI